MTTYTIPTPERLRDVAMGIKYDRDYRRVLDFANAWYESGQDERVTLEIGKSAQLCRYVGKNRYILATLYTKAAKDILKGAETDDAGG